MVLLESYQRGVVAAPLRPFGLLTTPIGLLITPFREVIRAVATRAVGWRVVYICPASTILTTRSVMRSVPSGSYFLVRLAPKSAANAW